MEARLLALLLGAAERLGHALERNWSVDWVPRPDTPLTVSSLPLRMASIMRVSSATFLIQAPSFCVYMANLVVPISALASELALNG